MYYSSTSIDKSLPCGYSGLFKLVKEYKNKYKEDDEIPVLDIVLPEPNFTLVLQGVKSKNGVNVWTDNIIEFSEIVLDVHVRVSCKGKRLQASVIQKFKGKNNA